MKSLRKVMSIALTVAMLFTLLVPATFVSAEVAPALSMSYVDASGNAVTALNPGMRAYLRVSVSGLEQIQTMGIKVSATGADFDTTPANLVQRFKDNAAFIGGGSEIMEIDLTYGVALTASSAFVNLTDSTSNLTVNAPVTVSAFDLVDIPFTVTAAKDETVSFEFATGTSDTYVQVGSAATTKWSIGHSSRPLTVPTDNKISTTVTEIPYAITAISLDPAFAAIPQNTATDYEFPGFGDSKVKAVYDLDRDEDSAADTASYDIITDPANVGELTAYAYINVPADIAATKGEKTLNVTVYDSSIKDTNGDAAGQYSGTVSINVTNAVAKDPVEVRADDTKVVEVKYGTANDDIIAAIQARDDLFKKIYTDGSATAAEIDLTGATVELGALDSTVVGTTDVTVSEITGVNAVEGTIKVKVNPTTITAIELTPAWEAKPEGVEGDAFPGFDGYAIKATFDSATSAITETEYNIVTDAAANGVAYVDASTYDAAAEGSYTFPVVIKDSDALSADYNGNIAVTVAAAVATDKIKIDADYGYIGINYTDDNDTAVADAIAAVEAAIADGLILVKMTNGEYDVAEADIVAADSASPDFDALKVTVSLVIENTDYAWEDGAVTTVDVSMGEAPAILSAKFVDAEGADVTPSIKAALEEYADDASELAMDWSAYKVLATYENPNPAATDNLTQTYDFYTDGATKYFEVENWVDFADGAEIGDQTVTIKIYDTSKSAVEGEAYAYAGTATATIAEADSANIVKLTDKTISVKNGTSEEDALDKLYDTANLYVEIMKDGSEKDSDVMITEATIADYSAETKGEYEVTVVATDAEEGIEVINEAELIIRVKAKSSGGTAAGTVVGGGGKVSSSVVDKTEDPADTDDKTDDKEDSKPGTPIPEDHWAAEIVENLTTAEVIDGAKETVESLDVTLTREEAAMVIAKALKLEMTGSVDSYTDADQIAAEYKDYVAAASAAGIFEGHDDGSFDPKGNLTREQVAAVIIRAYGFGEGTGELTFADADQIGWAKGYVAKAAELGIVDGYSVDNTFRPTNSITRAEAFAIVSRAMNLKNALDDAVEEVPADEAAADEAAADEAAAEDAAAEDAVAEDAAAEDAVAEDAAAEDAAAEDAAADEAVAE